MTATPCEVCAKRPAVTVVVVQHLAVSVCGVCWLLAKARRK